MPKARSISARCAPCNGQELAPGLVHARMADKYLTNNESGVEIQQVAMFAERSGASGVGDFCFANFGSHVNIPKNCARDFA